MFILSVGRHFADAQHDHQNNEFQKKDVGKRYNFKLFVLELRSIFINIVEWTGDCRGTHVTYR